MRTDFEAVLRTLGRMVVSTSFNEVQRIANADTAVFSTFYQRVQAGLQIPRGQKWDILRGVVEHAVFPGYKDHIRFGSLSLDGVGLTNYGECSVTLREQMAAHRTTLFEDNNVIFTAYEQGVTLAGTVDLGKGFRSVWDDREKLCVAKLAGRLRPGLDHEALAGLMIENGASTQEDRFVETHTWGSITVRSIEHVRILRRRNRPLAIAIKDLQRALDPYGVTVEIR